MNRRVVITGAGAVSPVGLTVPAFWDSLKNGRHGIRLIDEFDTSDVPVKVAALIKDFDPTQYIDKKEVRRTDRYCQFAIAAAKEAVTHLLDLGHRNIGCLSGPATNVLYRDRLTGYLRALAEHDIPVNMGYVSYGNSTLQSGYDRGLELLLGHPEITAVFAAGDVMAIGSMKAARKLGRRIPQDYAVVGFDDLDITRFCDPPLTTIHQPMFEIGKYSMQTLLDLIEGKPTQNQRLLEYRLIVRESTVEHA